MKKKQRELKKNRVLNLVAYGLKLGKNNDGTELCVIKMDMHAMNFAKACDNYRCSLKDEDGIEGSLLYYSETDRR